MDEIKKAMASVEPKKRLFDPKLALLLVGLIVLWFVFISIIPAESNSPNETVNVSFKANAGEEIPNSINANVLDVTTKVTKGTNAFDAMQEVAEIEFTDYGEMGVMIDSINGTTPEENEFWKLFVNGEEAMVGISSIILEEDTAIEWQIDSFDSYTG